MRTFDEDGFIEVDKLTIEEKQELIDLVGAYIKKGFEIWNEEYKPEFIDISELDEQDERYAERLTQAESADSSLVWTQVNDTCFDLSESVWPVEGLNIEFSGELIFSGFMSKDELNGELIGYHLTKKSSSDSSPSKFLEHMNKFAQDSYPKNVQNTSVWLWVQFPCPFCEAETECPSDYTSNGLFHSGNVWTL